MKLDCGCIIDGRDRKYIKMCLAHIKSLKPNVNNWVGDSTHCPYTCCVCGHKTGWSWIEPNHDCNNPMFSKKGRLLKNYNSETQQVRK